MSGYIHGKTAENAKALLDFAQEVGEPAYVVQVTDDGFEVPDNVYEAYVAALGPPADEDPEPASEQASTDEDDKETA